MKHFRIQFTNSGNRGIFVTEAKNPTEARKNFYMHYPIGVIHKVKIDREARA